MQIIGTRGWSLPKEIAQKFPEGGPHLERYSRILADIIPS